MPVTRSISKQNTSVVGAGCGMAFIGLFLLVFGGAGFTVAFGLSGRELLGVLSARTWQPAECLITFSQVVSSGKTSRINMQYRYVWGDRTYTGKSYDFTTGSDNFNDAGKAAIVGQHRPGQTVACFVNPADPTQAVIDRSMKWSYLFGLAFGTPFMLVPVLLGGSILYSRRKAKRQFAATIVSGGTSPVPGSSLAFAGASGGSATLPVFGGRVSAGSTTSSASSFVSDGGGPITMKPESTRVGRVIGMTFVCLFWNGLVGVFTYFEVSGRMHEVGWFLILFLIPFQLIGLLMIWGVISSVLALANPRPTLTLSGGSVPVGGSLTLQWQMKGATGRLRNLRILLTAREEVRYRRGTTTYTDTHTFFENTLLETTEPSRIERGMATVTIPGNTMHSFRATDNKIIWALKLHGEITLWPDVDETFDLVVRPK